MLECDIVVLQNYMLLILYLKKGHYLCQTLCIHIYKQSISCFKKVGDFRLYLAQCFSNLFNHKNHLRALVKNAGSWALPSTYLLGIS